MKKIGFISLGCPKNLVDSEVMLGELRQSGYEITTDASEADTLVVNTCGFIESAKKESVEAILKEAQGLAAQGVKELVLVAQDSSRYGEDLGKQDALAHLLRELSHLDGIEWVRVMYTYPTHISDAFLDVLATEPKAVKYLDLPLQHASANVLKLMRRGGTRASLEKLIGRVRERVPGIAIRTTFITGFPGETEEDFEELLAFVPAVEFDRVGVFTYSDDEGTPAFLLPNKVDAKTAKRRRAALMKEQARISGRRNKERLGSTVRVIFEGQAAESDLLWQGRLETQAPDIDGCVLINDAPEDFDPVPGKIINVLITDAHDYDIVGRIVR